MHRGVSLLEMGSEELHASALAFVIRPAFRNRTGSYLGLAVG